VFVKRYVKVV